MLVATGNRCIDGCTMSPTAAVCPFSFLFEILQLRHCSKIKISNFKFQNLKIPIPTYIRFGYICMYVQTQYLLTYQFASSTLLKKLEGGAIKFSEVYE